MQHGAWWMVTPGLGLLHCVLRCRPTLAYMDHLAVRALCGWGAFGGSASLTVEKVTPGAPGCGPGEARAM
jgi:hypothetical protein